MSSKAGAFIASLLPVQQGTRWSSKHWKGALCGTLLLLSGFGVIALELSKQGGDVVEAGKSGLGRRLLQERSGRNNTNDNVGYQGQTFLINPILSLVMGSVMIIGLCLLIISCRAISRRPWQRSVPPNPEQPAVGIPSTRNTGVPKEVVQSYPLVAYSKEGVKGQQQCAVCLSDYEDKELLRQLPQCNHCFHPPCIDSWLKLHNTCPLCRTSLTPVAPTQAGGIVAPAPEGAQTSDEQWDDVTISILGEEAGGQRGAGEALQGVQGGTVQLPVLQSPPVRNVEVR